MAAQKESHPRGSGWPEEGCGEGVVTRVGKGVRSAARGIANRFSSRGLTDRRGRRRSPRRGDLVSRGNDFQKSRWPLLCRPERE